jgi:hypothetical protein
MMMFVQLNAARSHSMQVDANSHVNIKSYANLKIPMRASKLWTICSEFREHLGEDYEMLQLLVTCQQRSHQPRGEMAILTVKSKVLFHVS